MPRVYQRKPNALREKITIPMTADLFQRLQVYAVEREITPTAAARRILERALGAMK